MTTKIIDFSRYSSIKIGSPVPITLIDECSEIPKNSYIIGSCSNILIGNNPPALFMLSKKYDFIHLNNNILTIGGATPSGKIVSFCKKHDIGGFEFLSHLPGKLGGLVKMNAGLKEYEIFNNLLDISTCKGKYLKKEIDYGYRYTHIDSPILSTSFKVTQGFDHNLVEKFHKMRSNQPKQPSAGSCFKNPPNDYAGRLIDAVGLKGKRVGNMGWSEIHANFLVNYGDGTYNDAITLIKEARKKVFEKFQILLELEIIILDQNLEL
ncbi:MAG: UDP-N-acetylmuramate dehydrogenase [Epsilonproteobacteria bacterium]|nr:UDP-N-acetylmuramate dehydrogenase [Campylobacterota bacterium]